MQLMSDMGWLRWVGCLKIQVSLQNTGLFCRALLQKRPIFLSILLIVATPYDSRSVCAKNVVWYDSYSLCVIGLMYISNVRRFICIWLMCDITLMRMPYVWHVSRDKTHSHWDMTHPHETWLIPIQMADVRHDSFTFMCHMTLRDMTCHSHPHTHTRGRKHTHTHTNTHTNLFNDGNNRCVRYRVAKTHRMP